LDEKFARAAKARRGDDLCTRVRATRERIKYMPAFLSEFPTVTQLRVFYGAARVTATASAFSFLVLLILGAF
jgi:hypothetical protein